MRFVISWMMIAAVGSAVAATPAVSDVITDADYDAGFVLARIGHNEKFSFEAPAGSVMCRDWEAFGASCDWFRLSDVRRYWDNERWQCPFGNGKLESLTVFTYGTVRLSTVDDTTCLSPFEIELGIAPTANQNSLTSKPCGFWHFVTPSNSLVMTWQNVLLKRNANKPVSVQLELFADGSAAYRYDLSKVSVTDYSKAKVGFLNGGKGRVFTELEEGTTSLYFARLDPKSKGVNDPDGDGISTTDEIFKYRTNPYAADTDGDGLKDGEELTTYHSDPNGRYSLNGKFLDGLVVKLNGNNPFSRPAEDSATYFERLFYTGNPDGEVELPVSSDSQAVLQISASGDGCGELTIGNQVVPIVPGIPTLLVALPRNERIAVAFSGTGDLSPILESDDFCIGELNSDWRMSWIEFPTLKVSAACIHTLTTNCVDVALETTGDDEDYTCTWSSGSLVGVCNHPPRSATLSAGFPRSSTGEVSYRIDHPLYLFGGCEFTQRCEYCPKITDEEEGDETYLSTVDYPDQLDERWCWCWYDCSGCDCPCHTDKTVATHDGSPDRCPVHRCDYHDCEDQHRDEYARATGVLEPYSGILKLHKPLSVKDRRTLHVELPEDAERCCSCPDHWKRRISIGSKDHRLAVHLDGEPFATSESDCDLEVYGVSPSDEFDDAQLEIVRGTTQYIDSVYTVLGVGIHGDEYDLSAINKAATGFGLPVVMQTNVLEGTRLRLRLDVHLDDGSVHLAFGETDAKVELWLKIWDKRAECESYLKLIDSATKSSLDMPVAVWRNLAAYSTSDRETTVILVARSSGSVKLTFGYGAEYRGHGVSDEAVQQITVIPPPLLPDYDRNNEINDDDAALALGGPFRFWVNQDIWKGDNAFSLSFYDKIRGLVYAHNGTDAVVNGRNDLVNQLPIAVYLAELVSQWGTKRMSVTVSEKGGGEVRWGYGPESWKDVRKSLTTDVQVDQPTSSDATAQASLCGATLDASDGDGGLSASVVERCLKGQGLMYIEGIEKCENPVEMIVSFDGKPVFSYTPNISFVPVETMFRWHNLRGAADGTGITEAALAEPAEPAGWPDQERDDSDFYFVHGYNVSETEAREWGGAMFKRLWWSGCNSRFHVVTWYGNDTQIWIPLAGLASPDYHVNVEHAIATAPALAQVVNGRKGRKYIAAHSLGNMLVSEAIQNAELKYDRYFMLNAAVAAEAYDAAEITDSTVLSMTPESWVGIPLKYRANRWFEYEKFDEGDVRRTLTWRNRFASVGNAVNYYSTEEEVLKCDAKGESYPMLKREWAWYNQERNKGKMPLTAGRNEGGWEFNSKYKVMTIDPASTTGTDYIYRDPKPAEVAAITDDLRTSPVFLPLTGNGIHSEEILVELSGKMVAQYLADAIPAESYPAGFVSVSKLERLADCENLDMAKRFKSNGELLSDEDDRNWGHSTFLGAPYMMVYGLFDNIVANMKEGS